MANVFVYGTLKEGYGNNRLLEGCKKLCDAVSVETYRVAGYGFPMAYPDKEGFPLKGEIWEVDKAETMSNLDMLEGNGNFYLRAKKSFIDSQGEQLDDIWIYEIMRDPGEPNCPLERMPDGKEVYLWSR